jgi:hypothetical protein
MKLRGLNTLFGFKLFRGSALKGRKQACLCIVRGQALFVGVDPFQNEKKMRPDKLL